MGERGNMIRMNKKITGVFAFYTIIFTFFAGVTVTFPAEDNFLRIYPQKKSYHSGQNISISLFNRGAQKITLSVYSITESEYRKLTGNIWSPSYQERMKKVRLESRKAVSSTEYPVSEGGNYLEIPNPFKNGYYMFAAKADNGSVTVTPVMVSDLGIITKLSRTRIYIFTVHLKTGKPIPGSTIQLTDGKNKSELKSDKTGMAFLDFDQKWNPEAIQVSAQSASLGRAFVHASASPYTDSRFYVYISTEKPIYKNTHSVNWYGIIREYRDGKFMPYANRSIQYKILTGVGVAAQTGKVTTDAFGKIADRWKIPPGAGGIAKISLEIEGERHQGEVLIKDYVAPQISVSVSTEKESYLFYEDIKGKISAKFLYGDIPAGATVDYTVYKGFYSPPAFGVEEAERFFDILTPQPSHADDVVITGKGVLDANGQMDFIIPKSEERKNMRYSIQVRVIAKKDRFTVDSGSGSGSVKIFASSFILQSKKTNYILSSGQKERLRFHLTDIQNRPMKNHSVDVAMFREVWDSKSGYFHQRAKIEYVPVKTIRAKTSESGEGEAIFDLSEPGRYRISLSTIDPNKYSVVTDEYYWVTSQSADLTGGIYHDLDIESDKTFYEKGETAKILITASIKDQPFYYSLEGENIYAVKAVSFANSHKELSIKLDNEAYLPNFYVHAFYVKDGKLVEGSLPLFISPREKFLQIEIQPERKNYRPKENVKVTVVTKDHKNRPVPASLTISVVDESVFLVQPSLAPDIRKFFYGRRPNRVATAYSFPDVFTGGDSKNSRMGDEDRFKFKDTAYFNNSVITDKDGHGNFQFTLPDNITAWRISAVGADGADKVGSSQVTILSHKELIADLRLPRYLDTMSEAEVVSLVHNRTGKPMELRLQWEFTGADTRGDKEKTVTVPAKDSMAITHKIKAPEKTVGKEVIIRFSAQTADGKWKDSIRRSIPIYESGMDHVISTPPLWIIQKNAGSQDYTVAFPALSGEGINMENSPQVKRYEMIVIPNLAASAMQNLEYLVEYPHGCTEQTTSQMLANLKVREFLKKNNIANPKLESRLDFHIKGGIKTILTMQNKKRGAWGWWQSESEYAVNHWMTAYAMYGLAVAKKSGYQVDAGQFKSGLKSLRDYLHQTGEEKYTSMDYSDFPQTESFVGFASYVLSISGEPDHSSLDALFELKEDLFNETLAWSAMAMNESGRRREAADTIAVVQKRMEEGTAAQYLIESPNGEFIFQNAMVYSQIFSLLKTKNSEKEDRELLMDILNAQKYNGKLVSTRGTLANLGTTIAFLEKYKAYLKSDLTITLSMEGQEKKISTKDRNSVLRVDLPVNSGTLKKIQDKIQVNAKGSGLAGIYFVAKVFEKTGEFKEYNRGIAVKRVFSRTDQSPFNGKIASGETLDVTITLNSGNVKDNYLMVTEKIPPGFVLESDYDYSYGRSNVLIEKDRIYFYLENYSERPVFRYRLRAVNSGFFLVPGSRAEFMYNDEIYGVSKPEVIQVMGGDNDK